MACTLAYVIFFLYLCAPKMIALFKNRYILFLTLLISNAFFFVLAANLLHIQYEENDDIIMCLIANGNFSGMPDFHLVFQNSIWGYLVSGLYDLLPQIEWYSILFSIIHVGAMSVITYCVIKKLRENGLLMICALICMYSIWMVTIQSFQFTTTAGILCIAGCLLLLSANIGTWGGICILTASLIRIEVAGLIGLLFVPLYVMENGLRWKLYLPFLWLGVLVLVPVVLERTVFYQGEWKEYYEYNKVRGTINDNPNIDKLDVQDIRAIGISEQDYAMLCGFNPDPDIITLPVLKQIKHCLSKVSISSKLGNLRQLVKYRIPIILLFVLTLSMLISTTSSKMSKMIIILWFLWMLLILGGLCLDHQLKNRVFICALFSMVVFCTMCLISIKKHALTHFVVCLSLLGLSGKYIYQCYKVLNIHKEKTITWYNNQLPLLNELPEDAVVATFSSLALEGMKAFHVMDFRHKLYPQGWLTKIPSKENLGYSHADLTSKNVYLLISEGADMSWLAQYIEKEYNIHSIPIMVTEKEKYSIIQLR